MVANGGRLREMDVGLGFFFGEQGMRRKYRKRELEGKGLA
jgi:hypothetical protein